MNGQGELFSKRNDSEKTSGQAMKEISFSIQAGIQCLCLYSNFTSLFGWEVKCSIGFSFMFLTSISFLIPKRWAIHAGAARSE